LFSRQSIAILEYLEETRPQRPLLPKDPMQRARVRQLVNIIADDTQPLQNQRILGKLEGHGVDKNAWAIYVITTGFEAFERVLRQTAGEYCVGNDVTMADICLIPQMYNAVRYGVDLKPFPLIVRIHAACEKLPEFVKAHANAQADAEK
jgi:maleylacetoacetate isomerase